MKVSLKSTLAGVLLCITAPFSQAVLITPDLSILGFAEFDITSDPFAGTGSQEGAIGSSLGGVPILPTAIDDITPMGPNPQGGLFTMLGDGVGAAASTLGESGDVQGGYFFDFYFDLTNFSGVDDYLISFGIDFSNTVDADGPDAYVDSEIVLEDEIGDEIFSSDLTSDTFFGDEVNGSAVMSAGDMLIDSGMFDFDITLLAGEMTFFDGFLKMDAAATMSSTFSAESAAFIYVKEVTKLTPPPMTVPTPATIMLFLTGSLGLLARKYLMKNHKGYDHETKTIN